MNSRQLSSLRFATAELKSFGFKDTAGVLSVTARDFETSTDDEGETIYAFLDALEEAVNTANNDIRRRSYEED